MTLRAHVTTLLVVLVLALCTCIDLLTADQESDYSVETVQPETSSRVDNAQAVTEEVSGE